MVADQEGGNHRTGWDLEGLDYEHADRKRQQHRDDNGFRIFSKNGLPARLCSRRHSASCGGGLRRTRRDFVGAGKVRIDAHSSPTFKMARKASCGTSTLPTAFIRFFPSF